MAGRYIFVAGAPGSKWSSVVKNIYYSPDIDRSDYTDERTYYHSAWGAPELMHLGAYFDPGMEFGGFFDRLPDHPPDECEAEFNRPFTGTGRRIVKSHVFCHHIDFLRRHWPGCPIVLVHRPNDACLGWWVRCREFRITYPRYTYYTDLDHMAGHIDRQNDDLLDAVVRHRGRFNIMDNHQLCDALGLRHPPRGYMQSYPENDIKVAVI